MIASSRTQDSGVSPVVGVMLILIITVVLAGVFALAATSMFSAKEAPIDAEINYLMTDDAGHYVFEMMAGDPFQKSKLKLVLRPRDSPADSIIRYPSDIATTHDSIVMLGDRLIVSAPDPATEFNPVGKYIIWMFFDTDSGTLISSGEIPPA
ncbi:MAG TPA: type IV pilin N-terminal domain-containing protein [Methanocorpusculum sp.]|nr:type IV pilin N-terminal domain-containing protein [Methanocorpusculum sp.]